MFAPTAPKVKVGTRSRGRLSGGSTGPSSASLSLSRSTTPSIPKPGERTPQRVWPGHWVDVA
eukprot:11732608-Alexandrium_andersonii.AAC.1